MVLKTNKQIDNFLFWSGWAAVIASAIVLCVLLWTLSPWIGSGVVLALGLLLVVQIRPRVHVLDITAPPVEETSKRGGRHAGSGKKPGRKPAKSGRQKAAVVSAPTPRAPAAKKVAKKATTRKAPSAAGYGTGEE